MTLLFDRRRSTAGGAETPGRAAWVRAAWMRDVGAQLARHRARGRPAAPGMDPPVVAVTFPLSVAERAGLTAVLGAGWSVLDIRRADRADVVLLPPCSQQAAAALRSRFPTAWLLVIDSPLDRTQPPESPIRRAFDAGVDAYAFEGPGTPVTAIAS